ncbi:MULTISPECIES: GNAT family N-acetyltransferase [Nitratireductor]|uniref:GNAT family N-acetyltransferase n=1 Tax=Nitratireductor TaxID=245876 RepID=UPI0019D3DBE7|nr:MULTISPECIES: GNAT family N-acetyltransferase [Nitratireductor]MBN7775810.1 GNAT family N-acetyltransferase [Nitratireductor pacificus]MBN7780473.1 GNAT family N-acetyltransferase [Nitratireductor pacificus]MBN7789280.1 GNAT family N-acetyltransferase [Nitratireductor aquimarinus]MBY6098557.1 GNAT family N-acetyltransferase [Nitratireductor aquimarinus]MCA1259750.1 GNAT family N-acetyltransferase [Nitratireductor aquimarinus]
MPNHAVADTGFSIRPATADDAQTIHRAIMDLAAYLGEQDRAVSQVEDFRRFGFGPDAAFSCLIAETDGAFAGLSLFFPVFSTWLGKPGVYVQDLYVSPAARGRGVGEALLAATAAWSQARGGAYLRLSVDAENRNAKAFYARLGIGWNENEHAHAAYAATFEALASRQTRQE